MGRRDTSPFCTRKKGIFLLTKNLKNSNLDLRILIIRGSINGNWFKGHYERR